MQSTKCECGLGWCFLCPLSLFLLPSFSLPPPLSPSLSPFSFFFKQEQCVGYFGHFSAQQTVCNRCGTPRPVVWHQSGSLQNPAVTNLPAIQPCVPWLIGLAVAICLPFVATGLPARWQTRFSSLLGLTKPWRIKYSNEWVFKCVQYCFFLQNAARQKQALLWCIKYYCAIFFQIIRHFVFTFSTGIQNHLIKTADKSTVVRMVALRLCSELPVNTIFGGW